MSKQVITLTDNHGMFRKGSKLFKVHHYSGVRIVYEEINQNEYDERVRGIAETIAIQPDVDLIDVLRDALYDLPLKRLEGVESALSKELATEEPKINTTSRDRGTCINLAIGKRFAFNIRD